MRCDNLNLKITTSKPDEIAELLNNIGKKIISIGKGGAFTSFDKIADNEFNLRLSYFPENAWTNKLLMGTVKGRLQKVDKDVIVELI